MMFKILALQALYGLSDEQAEYQVRDRLSFMRFLGLGLGDRVPDRTTIRLFREALVTAGAMEGLFARFDADLKERGRFALGGQIIDAPIVEAPRQRLTREENRQIRDGEDPPLATGQGAPEGHAGALDGERGGVAPARQPCPLGGALGRRARVRRPEDAHGGCSSAASAWVARR
ncbi:Mobile element protein [Azospirillum argentinense]